MKTDLEPMHYENGFEVATLGAGCFWCVEAIYQQLHGVIAVIPGYAGGYVKNPLYHDICIGNTGHAEVCQITFDNDIISYDELLEVFWLIHDPTTLNKQGYDVGSQYRSVIFYHNLTQKQSIEEFKSIIDNSGEFAQPIVTEITRFAEFYKAEDYHLNYYYSHPKTPYCSTVISPKIAKFRKVFSDKLKFSGTSN